MTDASWQDLADEFNQIRPESQPLFAQWFGYAGCEDYGNWLLRPEDREKEEVRAAFSLLAARAIEKLGIPPMAAPQISQHCPHWQLYLRTDEMAALQAGQIVDLSEAVPYGLGQVDVDAIDPCTRAWLEVLRRDGTPFAISTTIEGRIGDVDYRGRTGKIRDVCRASAIFCLRAAREEIGGRIIRTGDDQSRPVESAQALRAAQQRGPKKADNGKRITRNATYEKIDEALSECSAARPKSHEEVFRLLDERKIPIPRRRVFTTAGGWLKGFKQDRPAAGAWLSQAWGRLGLPAFARGPKK